MNSLPRLLPYLKKYKGKLFIGLIVILLGAVFTNIIPYVIKGAIDSIKSNPEYTHLINYAVLTLGLALLSGIFLYFTRQTIIVVSRLIEYDLRNDFVSCILSQDQQYFHFHPTGEIMALATNDISAVRNFLGPGIMYTSETVINFLMAIGLMLSLNVGLTLAAFLPIPLISYVVYRVSKSINNKFNRLKSQY